MDRHLRPEDPTKEFNVKNLSIKKEGENLGLCYVDVLN